MTIVPYTDMLDLYWRFKRSGGSLTWAETWLKTPEASANSLASAFAKSVDAFSIYENEKDAFHGHAGGFAPPLGAECWAVGGAISNGNAYAAALIADVRVSGFPTDVTYVDREPDCLRTSTRHYFEGSSVSSAEAVLPDLVLAGQNRFPILAEVKVGKDANAVYGLVQVLAAASHLVTPSQRRRLASMYRLEVPSEGACLDLFILLHEPPTKGKRPMLACRAIALAEELLAEKTVAAHIRDIRFYATAEPAEPAVPVFVSA